MMTERTITEPERVRLIDILDNPQNYPWKQYGTKNLSISTDVKNVKKWMNVFVTKVSTEDIGAYIVKLHNADLERRQKEKDDGTKL